MMDEWGRKPAVGSSRDDVNRVTLSIGQEMDWAKGGGDGEGLW